MTDASPPSAPSLSDRVAAAVRAEAARKQMTQRELAAALDLQQPNVSLRMRGKVPFTIDELGKLAVALGVPVERFLEDVTAGAA